MENPSTPQSSTTKEWSPPLPEASGFSHEIVETPGLRTHVATIGTGETVVMLHGYPQHWWQWRTIAPSVAAAGYRVICPDLRGQGWTEADEPGFRREWMLHDLTAVLDAMGVDRLRLVSHDLGAVVAGQFAYAHPDRVRAAVQFSVPPGFMAFSPRIVPAFAHMPRMLMHRTGQPLEWLFGEGYVATPFPPEVVDGYLRVQQRPEVARGAAALYRGMIIPESMRLASGHYRRQRLRPPTLAVFGRQDGPFSERNVRIILRDPEKFADRLELAFVEGSAHFLTDDAPEPATKLILDWFDRVG